MEDKFDILLIEDNPADLRLVNVLLKDAYDDSVFTITAAKTLSGGFKLLSEKSFDVILLDLTLSDSNGLDTFKRVFEKTPETPIIIITGHVNEIVGLSAMKLGAQDFLIKGKVQGKEIRRSINYSIERNKLLKELSKKTKEIGDHTMELMKEKVKLAMAQKLAHIGSWEWVIKDNALNWSEELFEIYGLKPEGFDVTSEAFFQRVHKDDRELTRSIIFDSYQTMVPFNFYHRIVRPSHEIRIIHAIGEVIKNEQGEPLVMFGTGQDITERIHEEELERTNQIKEQFLTNMSHEIRTPMNAIVGFTDLVLKTELSSDQRQYIEAIKTSGRNLIVIINDILDFSKLEAGKIIFEQIEFDLRHLISMLTELILPKSMEKDIRISTKIDKLIPVQLIGDPTRLNQVFLNLVGNAIKFTEKGSISILADIISEDTKNIELRFTVTDTGIGIPEDKLASIFEGFTQATNDTSRKYGGTGLGLAIVKQLVELQGGSISVTSRINEGTSFVFNFQFMKTDPLEAVKNQSDSDKSELLHINDLSILLVEDNHLNQILAKKVLTNWNWNVDVAENGLIALEKIKDKTYDLILMDIQMPEMNGYEAARSIRMQTDSPNISIPIIAITAHAISGEAEKCFKAGMTDYISKPFDEKVLYEKIIRACQKQETKWRTKIT